jgi:hypothetical protein
MDRTHLFHRVGKALGDLIVQCRLHLILRDVLERRKDRALNLRLDRHLNDTSGVPSQLRRDKFQDLLLTRKISSLLVHSSVVKTLL